MNLRQRDTQMNLKVWRKVWRIPLPGQCAVFYPKFDIPVESVKEGVKILDVLEDYDAFQFENNIKPDYCNASGLAMFDAKDTTASPTGSWVAWYDLDSAEIDPRKWLEENDLPKELTDRANISRTGLLAALDQAIELLPAYNSPDWGDQPDNCKNDVNFCLEYLVRFRKNIAS